MKRMPWFLLVVSVLVILACNSVLMPVATKTPVIMGRPTLQPSEIVPESNKEPIPSLQNPSPQAQPMDKIQPQLTVSVTLAQSENNAEVGDIPETSTLCKNDYFPVVKGARWVWKFTSNVSLPYYQLNEISDVSDDGFTVFFDISPTEEFTPRDNPSPEQHFKMSCLPDGLGTSSDISIPKAMPLGFTWQGQQPMTHYLINYESLGPESITVPAGTFDAVKVKQNIVSGQDNTGYRWYVKGIGMVKSYDESSGTSLTTELISYLIPK